MKIETKAADGLGRIVLGRGVGFILAPRLGATFPVTVKPNGSDGSSFDVSDSGTYAIQPFDRLEVWGASGTYEVTLLETAAEWREVNDPAPKIPVLLFDWQLRGATGQSRQGAKDIASGDRFPAGKHYIGPGGLDDATVIDTANYSRLVVFAEQVSQSEGTAVYLSQVPVSSQPAGDDPNLSGNILGGAIGISPANTWYQASNGFPYVVSSDAEPYGIAPSFKVQHGFLPRFFRFQTSATQLILNPSGYWRMRAELWP